jgi:hypothetical protein
MESGSSSFAIKIRCMVSTTVVLKGDRRCCRLLIARIGKNLG